MKTSRLVLLGILLATMPAGAEIDRDLYRYRGATASLELIVPAGWDLSEHVSYPGMLVTAIHRNGPGRLTLAHEIVGPAADVRSRARRAQRVLRAVGYRAVRVSEDARGVMHLRALTPDEKTAVRQAFKVENGTLFVLTLAAPAARSREYEVAFEDTWRTVKTAPAVVPEAEAEAEAEPETGAEMETERETDE